MNYFLLCLITVTAVAKAMRSGNVQGTDANVTLKIKALQWNPHYQCFTQSAECKSQVMKALFARLENATDFANVVELETNEFVMPKGWANLSSSCGDDITTLFFNAARWKPLDSPSSGGKGCMINGNRPYVMQAFKHLKEDFSVVVTGAHFPHRTIGKSLGDSLHAVTKATGITPTMLIADTNTNSPGNFPLCPKSLRASSSDIFEELGVVNSNSTISTELLKSCCLNPPYRFRFQFDRIIANFGTSMATQLHDDPVESWAIGEFHKAISGVLEVPLTRNAFGPALSDAVQTFIV